MIQLFPYKCSAFIDLHYYLLKSYFAPCIVPAVGGWSDKQNKQTSCLHETFTWEQMGPGNKRNKEKHITVHSVSMRARAFRIASLRTSPLNKRPEGLAMWLSERTPVRGKSTCKRSEGGARQASPRKSEDPYMTGLGYRCEQSWKRRRGGAI